MEVNIVEVDQFLMDIIWFSPTVLIYNIFEFMGVMS